MRVVTALAASIAVSGPALSQEAPGRGRSVTDLAERSAEMSFLSEACGDPRYKFTIAWLNQVGSPQIADQIGRRFTSMIENRPRPSKSRACNELLLKFGPNGIVERGWIEERTP